MDNVVINITDTPNEVTANITDTPINVTINVTEGGGGMQCADLAACQTIIDIQQAITDAETALSTHESDVNNPHETTLQQAVTAGKTVTGDLATSANGLTKFQINDDDINIVSTNGVEVGSINVTPTGNFIDNSIRNVFTAPINEFNGNVSKNGYELATEDFVDNRVQSNIKIIGDWDASSGSYPLPDESNTTPFIAQWGSSIKVSWAFRVGYGQAGDVGGYTYEEGDVVYSLIDNPTNDPSEWGDLDHNLQQANESLRGTAKIVESTTIADELNSDDERIVTPYKLWSSFWPRVLAIAHTFAAKITFTTAPRFNSATNNSYLKTGPFKDLTSLAAIPATDITEDATHRFATDTEKANWNNKPVYAFVSGTDFTTTSLSLTDVTGLTAALDANSVYEFMAKLTIESSSNAGLNTGVNFSAAGATIAAGEIGARDTEVGKVSRISAFNSSAALAWVRVSATPQTHEIKGIIRTGANPGNLTIKVLKTSSGTAKVYIDSYLKTTKI